MGYKKINQNAKGGCVMSRVTENDLLNVKWEIEQLIAKHVTAERERIIEALPETDNHLYDTFKRIGFQEAIKQVKQIIQGGGK